MERITHHLIQGSPEWLLYRATHDNASDAAAMLGISPYKSRNELLHERWLGLQPEFSDYVQKRVLDPGHEFEALARKLAEEIMEEELFAVVMSYGDYSASFDGLNFEHSKHWEHKRLSAELAALLPEEFNAGALLPKYHRVQVEQQFMVAASEECLFTGSKWNGDQLLDARHAWCFPDFELRAEIVAGWEQFRKDLAAYVPSKPEAPKATGKTMDQLPTLAVKVEGKLTDSNLDAWKLHALKVIRSVNRDLSTDEDFATADNMVKWCGNVESSCDSATAYIRSQIGSIDQALKAVEDVKAEAAKVRIELKNLTTKRKTERKEELVGEAVAEFHKHVADLNASLAPYQLPTVAVDFAAQVKNKRDFKSMKNALDTELARGKIEADKLAASMKSCRALIELETEYAFLFNDAGVLIHKGAETVALLVHKRVNDHKAAKAAEEEATRARIAAEEKEKAEAAARTQAAELVRQEREAQEARDREAKAEADRIAANEAEEARLHENHKREEAEREQRRQDADAQAERAQAEADLQKLGQAGAPVASAAEESIVSSSLESFEQPRRDPLYVPGFSPRSRAAAPEPAPVAEEAATVSLGKIAECLGFRLDEEFITTTLGIAWRRKERSARLWSEGDYELIRQALIKHLQGSETAYIPF